MKHNLFKRSVQISTFVFVSLLPCLLSADIYVSPTGNNESGTGTQEAPFASIQKAIDLATGSKEKIHLSEGTFYIDDTIQVTNDVEITGAGCDKTIINGNRLSSRIAVINHASAILTDVTLDGCTNTAKTADSAAGVGAIVKNGHLQNAEIRRMCISVLNNGQQGYACGVKLDGGVVSNVVIHDCRIPGKSSVTKGIGAYITGGLMTDCVVSNNIGSYIQYEGAGINISGGTLRNTEITECYGLVGQRGYGALYINGKNAVVENIKVHDCKAGVYVANGTLRNALVYNNVWEHSNQKDTASLTWANSTAGIKVAGGNVYNCTSVNNTFIDTIYKNLNAGTETVQDDMHITSGTSVNNIALKTCVGGGEERNNLFNTESVNIFRTSHKSLFHLKRTASSAVNKGDSSVWKGVANPVDLDGNPRIVGEIDKGCYEVQPPSGTVLILF